MNICNYFLQNVEQAKVTEKLVARVPFSHIENIQNEASTSNVLSTQGTSVEVPKSSASSKDKQVIQFKIMTLF